MKIIGFVYRDGQTQMVLKGDSCLLNGRKPMFVPDWTNELCASDCIILRVSRLGKEIALPFADRYYDAIAPGVDFVAMDKLREAQAAGNPWTAAIAFDYSLAIGEWTDKEESGKWKDERYILSPEEAIVEASKVMTIRQGDLIYIQKKQTPYPVAKEDVITGEVNGKEVLYCKIK